MKMKALLLNGALVSIAFLTLSPLIWMVSVSFMEPGAAGNFPPPLVPEAPTLANYRALLAHTGMASYFLNSLIVVVGATGLSLSFNVAAGYAFAKLRFVGRDRIFRFFLAALVIPGQVGTIPLFLMLKQMGLVNTYAGVLVPYIASIFGIFLVRQYALAVPDEMLEAARVDGATEFRIFRSIVLPVLRPVMATLAVFSFLTAWNDFLWPLIILTDDEFYTLPVALAVLSREHVQDSEMMMAGSVITLLPPLAVFLALQRYYMAGVFAGSVKG